MSNKLFSLSILLLMCTTSWAHRNVSPYVYCMNNPILLTDPDGRDVIISGSLASLALSQIQAQTGGGLMLSLGEGGYLCYDITGVQKLTRTARNVIRMIDNSAITVNMETTSGNTTSNGRLIVGGAFLGNQVTRDAAGNIINVDAYQMVNPEVLGKADAYSKKGTFIMHELTEAYKGAEISTEQGTSSPEAGEKGSVYNDAHNKATHQPPVYQRMLDTNGNITTDPSKATRVEWYVKPYDESSKESIIQTYP